MLYPEEFAEDDRMNDKWLELAVRVQSIAQAGLWYGKDKYDRERYAQLRDIAAEMLALRTDMPAERIAGLFCNESGYQTPKIDTRAAVFIDGKILLVHENNGSAAGATLTSPSPPTPRRRCARRPASPSGRSGSSPSTTGESAM